MTTRFVSSTAIEARLLTDAFDKFLKLPAGTIYGSSSMSPERHVTGGSSLIRYGRLIANIWICPRCSFLCPYCLLTARIGCFSHGLCTASSAHFLWVRRIDGERSQLVTP